MLCFAVAQVKPLLVSFPPEPLTKIVSPLAAETSPTQETKTKVRLKSSNGTKIFVLFIIT